MSVYGMSLLSSSYIFTFANKYMAFVMFRNFVRNHSSAVPLLEADCAFMAAT